MQANGNAQKRHTLSHLWNECDCLEDCYYGVAYNTAYYQETEEELQVVFLYIQTESSQSLTVF